MSKNKEENIENKEPLPKTVVLEERFRIDQGSVPGRYTLYVKKVINKGKDTEREDWDLVGYDFYMSTICSKLCHIFTDKQLESKVVDLKGYMKLYKDQATYFKHLFEII